MFRKTTTEFHRQHYITRRKSAPNEDIMHFKLKFCSTVFAASALCIVFGANISKAQIVSNVSQSGRDEATVDLESTGVQVANKTTNAPPNSPFNDDTTTTYTDPNGGTGTGDASQTTSFGFSGGQYQISATGQGLVNISNLEAIVGGETFFTLTFDVTSPQPYTFDATIFTLQVGLTPPLNEVPQISDHHAFVQLVLNGTTTLIDMDNTLNATAGMDANPFSFSTSGTLAPGEYSLQAQGLSNSEVNATNFGSSYSLDMTIGNSTSTGGSAVPLPAAAWSCLPTLICLGAAYLFKKRRALTA
jgi:hypothetical protein